MQHGDYLDAEAPFDSTLTESGSVAVNAFTTTGNLVLVFQM